MNSVVAEFRLRIKASTRDGDKFLCRCVTPVVPSVGELINLADGNPYWVVERGWSWSPDETYPSSVRDGVGIMYCYLIVVPGGSDQNTYEE